MSSATKSTKAPKVPKTTETIESSTDSTINNMEEQHSIFKGDFSKKGSLEAKYFLKHFRAIKTEFLDEDSATKILRHIFGGTEEELAKLVKDNDKKDKIKAEAFVPTNLEKPKKAIDLFGVLFSKESKEKGIKFNNSDNNYLTARKTAWDKLPVKTQSTYVKQAELELKNYTTELAKQKELAIKNGDIPAEKLKAPCSAYFLFLAEIRPKLNEEFKDDPKKSTKITIRGGELWKSLSSKDREPYETAYRTAKAEYDIKHAEWKANELERCKKNDGQPLDIKVESSGEKSVSTKDSNVEESNSDTNEKSTKTKSTSKTKKSSTVKQIIEADAEAEAEADGEDESVPEPVKATKAKATKAKDTTGKGKGKAKAEPEPEPEPESADEPIYDDSEPEPEPEPEPVQVKTKGKAKSETKESKPKGKSN